MAAIQFSELEMFNLTLLLAMRDSIARDADTACGQFGLREDDARYLASLSTTQILATVANVGPQALFTPRVDLFAVMQAPLPLAAPLLAVHPQSAVQPNVAAPHTTQIRTTQIQTTQIHATQTHAMQTRGAHIHAAACTAAHAPVVPSRATAMGVQRAVTHGSDSGTR